MAFELTNKAQFDRRAPGQPGVLHYELADQDASGTLTDTGVAGCKFIRARIMVKSGLSSTNTAAFSIAVDNAAGGTSPERVAWADEAAFVTGDTNLTFDLWGWSNTGFRAFKITGTDSGGTMAYDAIVDVW